MDEENVIDANLRKRMGTSNQPSFLAPKFRTHSIDLPPGLNSSKELKKTRQKYKRLTHRHLSSTFSFFSIIFLLSISFLFVKYMDNRLPEPLTKVDAILQQGGFIEERARDDLSEFTKMGPRVTGSFITENTTVELFLDVLSKIATDAKYVHVLDFEVQKPSGTFSMDDDEGHTSTYSKISNVVAKLDVRNESSRSNDSILFNCHFDSKPGSPGATDNMISCVTMLEILRVLTFSEVPLKNSLVFLFNGAEELGLQGAHGFSAGQNENNEEIGHRWAKNLKAFVNLEGAGAGGRPILFQTGPGDGWILELYANSVHLPFGTALAEEAFQMELIPSDTDFRIFRDFSHIPGLDISFIKNGWIYHTKYVPQDKIQEIPPGSIQSMGNTALALAKSFGNLDFSDVKSSNTKMVFFDIFGIFMITYSETVGIILNALAAITTIGLILYFEVIRPKKYLNILHLLGSGLLAWGVGIGVGVGLGALLNAYSYYSPFHSHPSLLLVIFALPATLAQIITFSFCARGRVEMVWGANKLLIALIVLGGTFVTRAVFMFMINLVFTVPTWYLAKLLLRDHPKLRTMFYLSVGELIPLCLSLYLINILNDVFVPVMARSGPSVNPNIFLALITSFTVPILALNGLIPFCIGFKKTRIILVFILSVLFINPLVIFGMVGKIPYEEKTAMRLNLIEVDRQWFKEDSNSSMIKNETGVIFWPMDPNTGPFLSIISQTVPDVKHAREFSFEIENCEELYCGVPQIWTASKTYKKIYWLERSKNAPRPNVGISYTKSLVRHTENFHIDLTLFGSTQISFIISPSLNFNLVNSSLSTNLTKGELLWNGRSTYFIMNQNGDSSPFNIKFELSYSGNGDGNDTGLFELHFASFFLYGEDSLSQNMKNFVDEFPTWVYPYSWSSVVQLYKFTTNL